MFVVLVSGDFADNPLIALVSSVVNCPVDCRRDFLILKLSSP